MLEHEVHTPHQGHEGPDPLSRRVALMTALLATLSAVIAFQTSDMLSEAILAESEATLKKAAATDQWNYYQATSTKLHLTELTLALAPADQAPGLKQRIEKYTAQREEIEKEAKRLDQESREADARSAAASRPHRPLALALTLLQVAISLASITALTRMRWLLGLAGASAAAAAGLYLTTLLAAYR